VAFSHIPVHQRHVDARLRCFDMSGASDKPRSHARTTIGMGHEAKGALLKWSSHEFLLNAVQDSPPPFSSGSRGTLDISFTSPNYNCILSRPLHITITSCLPLHEFMPHLDVPFEVPSLILPRTATRSRVRTLLAEHALHPRFDDDHPAEGLKGWLTVHSIFLSLKP